MTGSAHPARLRSSRYREEYFAMLACGHWEQHDADWAHMVDGRLATLKTGPRLLAEMRRLGKTQQR